MVWWYVSIPTSSKSLCFPLTRKHFWVSAIRLCFTGLFPKKYSLNGTIPALVNIKVGSPFNTIGADGTIVCPFDLKKDRYRSRISFDVMFYFLNLYMLASYKSKQISIFV